MSSRRNLCVVERPAHLEIETDWLGLTPGDQVIVKGEPGKFTFVEHVTNLKTGATWVTVYGGPKGFGQMRSFDPKRVTSHGATQEEDAFAAAIFKHRTRLGLSRQTVADQCNLTYSKLSTIEKTGRRTPTEEQAVREFFSKMKIELP